MGKYEARLFLLCKAEVDAEFPRVIGGSFLEDELFSFDGEIVSLDIE